MRAEAVLVRVRVHRADPKPMKTTSKDIIVQHLFFRFYCECTYYCYREEEVADEQEPEGEDLNSEDVSIFLFTIKSVYRNLNVLNTQLVLTITLPMDLFVKEYDEEEDEEDDRPGKKKKKNERFGGFIIDEADVDDEVEEDDDWEDGAGEYGIVANEVDELGPTAREIEGRRRGTNLWE